MGKGDATAGLAFYTANNCATCHCANAAGGCLLNAPSLVGEDAAEIFARLSGGTTHTGGTVQGVTQQNAQDLVAWLGSL